MAETSHAPIDLSVAMITQAPALADWLVVAPIIVCLTGGAFLLTQRKNTALQGWLAMLILALLVAVCAGLLMHVLNNGPIIMTMGRWLPPFGITFAVDILGAVMALVASTVALFCGLYALTEIDEQSQRYGFFPFLILLLGGVCGAFLTGDIFNLYVWFEVLLIASFGLLILGNERPQLDGAVKYALLNLVATTLFLIATAYLYALVGTLNMADIAVRVRMLPEGAPINTIVALYLVAFSMKAAAFPVFFWLPASYHTPRSVVSAVFAGLLTKVGVYALLRIVVMLMPESRSLFADLLAWIAAATLIIGVLGALAQNDIRRTMGYLVISGIGAMLAGAAIASDLGLMGAILYAVHSMIVMTALYLVCGIMIRSAGTHDLRKLGALYGRDPLLAAIFLILALAVSGLPPFSGFWPKLTLVQAALETGYGWLAFAILINGFFTTIVVGRIWVMSFWRGGPATTPDGETIDLTAMPDFPPKQRRALLLPVMGLTVLVIAIGVLPRPFLTITAGGAGGLIFQDGYIEAVLGKTANLQGQGNMTEPHNASGESQ
ncbi:MAG: Na+/H+ antiporter subunit D [Hyphomicrobiales bacterium]|nr:MAG: Na+/H+ antiporter subunit D [Hyphomicrobiales bacterium]